MRMQRGLEQWQSLFWSMSRYWRGLDWSRGEGAVSRSATVFSLPGTCTIELINSVT